MRRICIARIVACWLAALYLGQAAAQPLGYPNLTASVKTWHYGEHLKLWMRCCHVDGETI